MTVIFDAPITTLFVSPAAEPEALSVQVSNYRAAIEDGAAVVDVRGTAERARSGALLGGLALEPDEALDALTPGSPTALRGATADARWLLVTRDGYDAEWLAWHLQARGVTGARFVLGGHRALVAARIGAVDTSDAYTYFI